jgi:hypothetical protein
MPVIMFLPRFHGLVATGAKRQTIREARKRPIKPGDPLSLRAWEGTPYRSKQAVLREAECVAVRPILIEDGRRIGRPLDIEVAGVVVNPRELDHFAQGDGFEDAADMARFWAEYRHLPFEGVVIYWR